MRIVAIFVCVLMAGASLFAEDAFAQIRLNEMLADPGLDWDGDGSVSSKNDEWIEVINTGSTSVDLSSYRISDASAATDMRFAFSGTLSPGEVRVVYGSDVVAWQQANGVGAFGLSLNNSGDTVFLFDTSGGDTVTVDEYTYVSAEVADDRAVGRTPDGTGAWFIFDGLNPYTGANPPVPSGCTPSPGVINNCTPALPIEDATWGAVKARFHE